jgi:hypothetical protein
LSAALSRASRTAAGFSSTPMTFAPRDAKKIANVPAPQ